MWRKGLEQIKSTLIYSPELKTMLVTAVFPYLFHYKKDLVNQCFFLWSSIRAAQLIRISNRDYDYGCHDYIIVQSRDYKNK